MIAGLRFALLLLSGLALSVGSGAAHDDPDPVDVLARLDLADRLAGEAGAAGSPAAEAEARCALAGQIDVLIDDLNTERATHGGASGLMSVIVEERLAALDIRPEVVPGVGGDPGSGHLAAWTRDWARCLALAPDGGDAGEAMFRLVRAGFRAGYRISPATEAPVDPGDTRRRIAMAERFLAGWPDHAGREEVAFVLAVERARLVIFAADPATARELAGPALAALEAFRDGWPDSLRAAAIPGLVGAVRAAY